MRHPNSIQSILTAVEAHCPIDQTETDTIRAEWFSLSHLKTLELDAGMERMLEKSIAYL